MSRRFRITGRTFVTIAAAAALIALSATVVLANHDFPDVATGAYYHDDVSALVSNGITSGCGGGKYCPNDSVSRGQMAVFLNKLGALGAGTTPVVTAAKLGAKAADNTDAATDLVNDSAYHILATGSVNASKACTLMMNGKLSTFTYNFSDYRRVVTDFFVDGVAVGMESYSDNQPTTSTFDSVAAVGFKAVSAGAHTVTLRSKITTGTNIVKIYEPTFVSICV